MCTVSWRIFSGQQEDIHTQARGISLWFWYALQLTVELHMMKTIQFIAFQIRIIKPKYGQDPNSWAQLKGLQLQPKLFLLSFLSVIKEKITVFLKPSNSLSTSLAWQCKFVCQRDDHDMKPTTMLCFYHMNLVTPENWEVHFTYFSKAQFEWYWICYPLLWMFRTAIMFGYTQNGNNYHYCPLKENNFPNSH